MTALEWLQVLSLAVLATIGVKSITGYHFPWEKCSCCGKRWEDHKEHN
jgi:hypothetical protein